MKQATIWTAAATATLGFAADVAAAPVTYDVTFTSTTPAGLTGTGFFTVDDSLIGPNAQINNVADVDAFGATFTAVPGFGTLSFDLGDLSSVSIKFDSNGEVGDVTFGTPENGVDPYLVVSTDSITHLKVTGSPTDPSVPDIQVASYFGEASPRLTAVPEPGTLALLAAGAASLPLLRRRRTERKSA
jgi:hypothetical protein